MAVFLFLIDIYVKAKYIKMMCINLLKHLTLSLSARYRFDIVYNLNQGAVIITFMPGVCAK